MPVFIHATHAQCQLSVNVKCVDLHGASPVDLMCSVMCRQKAGAWKQLRRLGCGPRVRETSGRTGSSKSRAISPWVGSSVFCSLCYLATSLLGTACDDS